MPGPRVSTGDRLSATHLPRRGTLSRLQLALRAACAGVLCAADPRRGLVPPDRVAALVHRCAVRHLVTLQRLRAELIPRALGASGRPLCLSRAPPCFVLLTVKASFFKLSYC